MYSIMTATVIFSVGEKHPLYQKPVQAVIESRYCGYDGRQVYAHTSEPVHYPADPEGIMVFETGTDRFLRYKERPAYDEVYSGYVDVQATIRSQYDSLKALHPTAILMWRDGDFYHLFNEDADIASQLFGLTVKQEGKNLRSVAFYHHSLDIYLPKAVRAGHRIAITDFPIF